MALCFVQENQDQVVYASPRTFMRVAEKIVDAISNNADRMVLKEIIEEFCPVPVVHDRLEILLDEILEKLKVPNEEIEKRLLRYRIDAEFGNNMVHVNYLDGTSRWELNLKDGTLKCEFTETDDELDIRIDKNIEIRQNVIYLDDFSIQNALGDYARSGYFNQYAHAVSIKKASQRFHKNVDQEEISAIDDILQEEKTKKIFEIMRLMDIGELTQKRENVQYISSNLKKPLEIKNLSSGLKHLLIIKQMIKNEVLIEKSVLILDEPEIHLHPEWQKNLAHIIVLLQKCMDVTVLISTHSTDFLSFIELYSKEYELQNKCKYYLLQECGDASKITDVTGQIDKIYELLGMPFLKASEELNAEDTN